jgi:GTPase SAR1 family protein
MNIWDTAGQEEFSKLTRNYYKGAQACVLAYSTTDRESFDAIPKWMQQAKDTIPDDIAWVSYVAGASGWMLPRGD